MLVVDVVHHNMTLSTPKAVLIHIYLMSDVLNAFWFWLPSCVFVCVCVEGGGGGGGVEFMDIHLISTMKTILQITFILQEQLVLYILSWEKKNQKNLTPVTPKKSPLEYGLQTTGCKNNNMLRFNRSILCSNHWNHSLQNLMDSICCCINWKAWSALLRNTAGFCCDVTSNWRVGY